MKKSCIMLFLFIILDVLPFILSSQDVTISYACKHRPVTVEFGNDESVEATVRYKKLRDGDKEELVASELKGEVDYYNHYKWNVEVDENRNLKIKNVSEKYEGVYVREIRNGGTFINKVSLKVLEPPSGIPTIIKQTDENDRVFLTCVNPKSLGNPKAVVVFKDGVDRIQTKSAHTINDNEYKCCLEGESVNRCYPQNLPKCSFYRTERIIDNATSSTIRDKAHNGSECSAKGWCIAVAVISWGICVVLLMAYIFVSSWSEAYKQSKTSNRGVVSYSRWRLRVNDIGVSHLIASFLLSVVFLTLSTGYFCSKEGCENGFYMSLIGVFSFFIGILPSFQSFFNAENQRTNTVQYKARRRKRAVNLTPHLDAKPLLDETDGIEMEQNEILQEEEDEMGSHEVIISGLASPEGRKQLRKYNKIEVLRAGMKHMLWNQNQKQEVDRILKPDYMSSEESEYEDDEGSERKVRKLLRIKRIKWEHEKVSHMKEQLYRTFEIYEGKSRYRNDKTKRRECKTFSTRPIPRDAPSWAYKGGSSTFLEFMTSIGGADLMLFHD